MFHHWRYRRRCCYRAKRCDEPVLADYLESSARLHIGTIEDTPLIAVDLELTGLDRKQDSIVAIGWTLIDNGRISFGGNRHILIAAPQSVGSSAVIHELLDSEVAEGEPIGAGLSDLFAAARGRAWVFHHAQLDIGFIKTATWDWAGVSPCFTVLDTLQVERRLRHRRDVPVKQGDLQLARLRDEYGLPRYTAHNALNDAFATAELTLAIAGRLEPDAPLRLKPYLRYY